MKFIRGVKDGIPIALGYLSVSFAYAVLAREKGFPLWFPILISLTNFTGTGQAIGTDLIALGASILELFTTMLIINIRYTVMSLSLSQKMEGFPLWQRFIVAFGVTDENFGVAIQQKKKLTFKYLLGLICCSFFGWLLGTTLGAVLGDIFPATLMSAFGIALSAMFVAIIIPPTKESKSILILVAISIALSCVFYFVPYLNKVPSGWTIIICSIICTCIISAIFPHTEQTEETKSESEDLNANEKTPSNEGVQK